MKQLNLPYEPQKLENEYKISADFLMAYVSIIEDDDAQEMERFMSEMVLIFNRLHNTNLENGFYELQFAFFLMRFVK